MNPQRVKRRKSKLPAQGQMASESSSRSLNCVLEFSSKSWFKHFNKRKAGFFRKLSISLFYESGQ